MGSSISRIRRSSTDSPASCLPVEIWQAIFDQLSISDLVTLLRVSRYISGAASAHDTYCRAFIIRADQRPLPSLDQLRTRLASPKEPKPLLCVDISFGHAYDMAPYTDSVLALVAEHMHRVECLKLDLPPSGGVQQIRTMLDGKPAPLLRSLTIIYRACHAYCFPCWTTPGKISPSLFQDQAPKLRDLQLHNVVLRKEVYPAFIHARELRLFFDKDQPADTPIFQASHWPKLQTLHVRGPYWNYEGRATPNPGVTISNMDREDQERALAHLTTPMSKYVAVTDPSTETSKTLSKHLDDSKTIYLTVRTMQLPNCRQIHLEFEDALEARRRLFVTEWDILEDVKPAAAQFRDILAVEDINGLIQRCSVVLLDYDIESQVDIFSLLTQSQNYRLSCEALCLTFGSLAEGSLLSLFAGHRELRLDVLPALRRLVICCYYPNAPSVDEATSTLSILLRAVRKKLSPEQLKDFELIYTRNANAAIQCARAPPRTHPNLPSSSWTRIDLHMNAG
ncbi:hypothetical protein EXIGLDRAFT_844140 [Exidia glandulosa HHB12029]|uniref:F-box domain-containing protein n=1 Tax=Exidia glandulosa HHB12029 TaxID=1314781 RepID=A0A165C7I4_EXIGL|nr:hypothetical protein EXIGLDRAFT_844140 [Exidia glandulosa HHB12029]